MTDHERCEQCGGKMIYPSRKWAVWDARELNRKKRKTGHMHPYRGPCGHWHVGRHRNRERHRAIADAQSGRFNWRVFLNRKETS